MIKEHLYDLLEYEAQEYLGGWRWEYRCVACGTVTDSTSEQNHTAVEPTAVQAVMGLVKF